MTHRDPTFADAPHGKRSKISTVGASRIPRVGGGRARLGQGPARPGAAVAKVHGHRTSVRATKATLDYVLSKAVRTEDDWGQEFGSPQQVLDAWGLDPEQDPTPEMVKTAALSDDPEMVWDVKETPKRQPRVSAHMTFSLPGNDPDMEWNVARAAARECFPDRPYVLALHTDSDSAHVHLVLKSRDYTGRALRVNREDLYHYRQVIARCGQERGLAVEARRYDVPTPPARWRCLFPEPIGKRLDRQVAVLANARQATPTQIRQALRFIKRHKAALRNPHRHQLLRATTTLEQFPLWRKASVALTTLAFKGEHGERFRLRRERSQRAKALHEHAVRKADDPAREPPRNAETPETPETPGTLTPRTLQRHAKALIRDIDSLGQRDRDRLAESLSVMTGRQQRKARRALQRTQTDVEKQRQTQARRRASIGDALTTLQDENAGALARRLAVVRLWAHRDRLTSSDRLALRRVHTAVADDPEASRLVTVAVNALCRRPVPSTARIGHAATSDVREHAAGAVDALTRSPKSPPDRSTLPPTTRATIDQALATTRDPAASAQARDRATHTLMWNRRHLSAEERAAITDPATRERIDAAIATLQNAQATPIAKQTAATALQLHKPHLTATDRLALRQVDTHIPGQPAATDRLTRQLRPLLQRPVPEGPMVAETASLRPHQRDELLAMPRDAEAPDKARARARDVLGQGTRGRAWAIDRALQALRTGRPGDLAASQEALQTLYRHRRHLSERDHRDLLGQVARWRGPRLGAQAHLSRLAKARAILAHAPSQLEARPRFDVQLAIVTLQARDLDRREVTSAVKLLRRHARLMTRDQRDDVYLSLAHHCGHERASQIQRVLDQHRPLRDARPLPPDQERTVAIRRALDTLARVEQSTPVRIIAAANAITQYPRHLSSPQRERLARCMPRVEKVAPHIAERLHAAAGLPERPAPTMDAHARARAIRAAFDTLLHPAAPWDAKTLARATVAQHRDALNPRQTALFATIETRIDAGPQQPAIRQALATLRAFEHSNPRQMAEAADTLTIHASDLTAGQRRFLTASVRRMDSAAPVIAERLYAVLPDAKRARDLDRAFDTLRTIATSSPEQRQAAVLALTTHRDALTDQQRLFVHLLLPRVRRDAPAMARELAPVTVAPQRPPEPPEPTPAVSPAGIETPGIETPGIDKPGIDQPGAPEPAHALAPRQPTPPDSQPRQPTPPAFHFPDAKPHPLLEEQLTLFQSADLARSLHAARFLHTYRHDLSPAQHRALADHLASWSAPRDAAACAPPHTPGDQERVQLTRQIVKLAPKDLAAPARLELALAVRDLATPETPEPQARRAIGVLQRHRPHVTAEQRAILLRAPLHQQSPRNHQALTSFLARTSPTSPTSRTVGPPSATPTPRSANEHLDIALATLQRYPHTTPERTRHALTALATLRHKMTDAQTHVLETHVGKLEARYPDFTRRLAERTRAAIRAPRPRQKPTPPQTPSQHPSHARTTRTR